MAQDITDAKRGMERFLQAQATGQKVFYMPYYSVFNLASTADATGLVAPQRFTFYQTGRGQDGNGFGAGNPLTPSETSLPAGANGTMPGGVEFIADSLGVDIFPSAPPHIKTTLTEKSFLTQARLSHEWVCGATRYWPCAEFGHQSLSVSTTVANSEVEYGVNGRVSMRRLPRGGEIYFPAKQQIQFVIETTAPFFATANGLAVGANNPVLGEVLVAVVMAGWQFEVITT
jgi:hypothetical protein